jgi:hypothetical protein
MSSTSLVTPYQLLTGEWPVLEAASPIPDQILEAITLDKSSHALCTHIQYLNLGYFYIDADLVVSHSSQRPIISDHAENLKKDFEDQNPLRDAFPGVVIGLGNGWNNMKNTGPVKYKITKDFPFLSKLSDKSNGPIAHVIRGGHRTEAIRRFSALPGKLEENYWLYQVLLPSK